MVKQAKKDTTKKKTPLVRQRCSDFDGSDEDEEEQQPIPVMVRRGNKIPKPNNPTVNLLLSDFDFSDDEEPIGAASCDNETELDRQSLTNSRVMEMDEF